MAKNLGENVILGKDRVGKCIGIDGNFQYLGRELEQLC